MTMIEVVDYDSAWPEDFRQECALILQVLEHTHLGVHHIGGTSVPGVASRPVVDILVEVTHLDVLDALSRKMEAVGYSSCAELRTHGGRVFEKVWLQHAYRVFAYQVGDSGVTRHLTLRDYLRGDHVLAAEYGLFKHELAQRCRHDPQQYGVEKADYLSGVESVALDALFPIVA